MDMSCLNFFRQFRGTRKDRGGGHLSCRVLRFPAGVAQRLSALAAFSEYAGSFTLNASAGGPKRYPDNCAKPAWSNLYATGAVPRCRREDSRIRGNLTSPVGNGSSASILRGKRPFILEFLPKLSGSYFYFQFIGI